jgi:hypothetical protein
MINSIILLSNNEYYEKFSIELRKVNPIVDIILLNGLPSLIALPHSLLERSRLISCLSLVIVPLSIIKKLKYGAYNFHPGPQSHKQFGTQLTQLFSELKLKQQLKKSKTN